MAYSRASVPELENLLKYGKKKFYYGIIQDKEPSSATLKSL